MAAAVGALTSPTWAAHGGDAALAGRAKACISQRGPRRSHRSYTRADRLLRHAATITPRCSLEQPLRPAERQADAKTTATRSRGPLRRLETVDDIAEALAGSVHPTALSSFHAFYSSVLGGVVTDPRFFSVPIDDHMVHRGHAVFDTFLLTDGQLYEVGPHLQRLMRSAHAAGIDLSQWSEDRLRDTILHTVAASGLRNGQIRCWLSVGPGNFGVAAAGCTGTSFYVMVSQAPPKPASWTTPRVEGDSEEKKRGCKMITSTIPLKPGMFATLKSTNYLPNALNAQEAADTGADVGLWIDPATNSVAEGSNMNVVFVLPHPSGEGLALKAPPFDNILQGCTLSRLLALLRADENKGHLAALGVKDVSVGPINANDAKELAQEIIVTSTFAGVRAVTEWDGQAVGDGYQGAVACFIQQLITDDYRNPDVLTPVPYLNAR